MAEIKVEVPVETKLGTLEWKKSPEPSVVIKDSSPESPCVAKCQDKPCTKVCPAKVYEWEPAHNKIIANYENCIECGACRMLCPFDNIQCEWPGGGMGVKYKYG